MDGTALVGSLNLTIVTRELANKIDLVFAFVFAVKEGLCF